MQRVTNTDVLVAWLIPITVNEAAFIRADGYRRFEDLLIDQDPDLQDLRRPPVVLPGS